MAVFLFEIVAILVFVRLADKSMLQQLMPLLVSGIFIRFMQNLVIIDWLQFMQVEAPRAMRVWIPISAEITVWLTASYLFVQYMPQKKPMLYVALWIALMTLYTHALVLLRVLSLHNGWTTAHSLMLNALFFLSLWLLWNWLRPQSAGKQQQAA